MDWRSCGTLSLKRSVHFTAYPFSDWRSLGFPETKGSISCFFPALILSLPSFTKEDDPAAAQSILTNQLHLMYTLSPRIHFKQSSLSNSWAQHQCPHHYSVSSYLLQEHVGRPPGNMVEEEALSTPRVSSLFFIWDRNVASRISFSIKFRYGNLTLYIIDNIYHFLIRENVEWKSITKTWWKRALKK